MVSSGTKSKDNAGDDSNSKEAPDGGWGWMIVIGAMVLNFLIGGAVNTFGVLYVALLDKFHQSAGTTAWVGSMANAMGLLLGPLSSALSTRFSCRTMVIIGGILTSAGWVTTGFMPRLEYMFITYGLLAGIGKSMSFTPSIVIVGQWFDRRRSLANGLSVSGAGLGTFAFAPLLETLLKAYGFTYTMLIIGGVMLIISACGVLFRPTPVKRKDTVSPTSEPYNKNISTQENGQVSWATVDENIKSDTYNNSYIVKQQTKTLKDYLDYTLLKNTKFLCFGISVMFATLGHSPASVMLPPLAKQYHVTSGKAAFLLSITGITDIIGRLVFGALCDMKALKAKRMYMYVASIFISGIANITCGFANTYWHFVTYSVIFGLFAGSYNALTPVILVDLLGVDKLSSSFGLALLFQGLGFLIGPPMAGWISDGFDTFQSAFYFAGIAMLTGSLIMNISSFCHRHKHNKIPESSGTRENPAPQEILDKEYENPCFVIDSNISDSDCNSNTKSVTVNVEMHSGITCIHESKSNANCKDFIDIRF